MAAQSTSLPAPDSGPVFAFLLLRIWLGLRALLAGIEKFAVVETSDEAVTIGGSVNEYGLTGTATGKAYGIEHYHGVPEALYARLEAEPLIPGFALQLFDLALGPLLILLGLMLLLGVATRVTLFAMGLLYTALTSGLILIGQDAGVAWLAAHLILIALALLHARRNRFAIMRRF